MRNKESIDYYPIHESSDNLINRYILNEIQFTNPLIN